MKICFIAEKIGSIGGVQRVVLTLANELAKNHEVTVLSIMEVNSVPVYETRKELNIDINPDLMKASFLNKALRSIVKISNKKFGYLDNERVNFILEKSYFPRFIKKRFINYINTNKFDVVIGAEGFCSLLLGTIKDDINCQVIGWQHNSYDAYFNKKSKYYWNESTLFKRLIPNLNQYIVLTSDDQSNIEKNLNIQSKVINNPLSFSSEQKTTLINKKIVSLGRFHVQKGFDNLIESFQMISSKDTEWVLEIYGEGEEEKHLQRLIKEKGLSNRVFLCPVTTDVKHVLSSASIYAMSSRWEGFGLVVTEALECGLPVVAFNTTGPNQILKGYNCGILVESNNISEYAKSLYKLMNDYEYRKELSNNALKRAEDFSVQSIAKEWIDMIMS